MESLDIIPHVIGDRGGTDVPRRRTAVALRAFAGPLAAAVVAIASDAPAGLVMLVLLAFTTGNLLVGREPHWAPLLPLMGFAARIAGPAAGTALLLGAELTAGVEGLTASGALALGGAAAVGTLMAREIAERLRGTPPTTRVAIIGLPRTAESLQRELRLSGVGGIEIVGRIATGPVEPATVSDVPMLGALTDVEGIVQRERLDLLLLTSEAPRLAVFDEVARSCLHLPVRLRELSGFYEELFGHIAVTEINSAWFQWIMHPNYRVGRSPADRVLDLVVAVIAGIAALPLLGIFALIIRRDGGPAFFQQVRIGERGRPFTLYKLRTMTPEADETWAVNDDPRVTAIGRFLRRTHLDELPQVLNVLRGEMSVIGPRPEQPALVDELERVVPYYQRRHLVRPGLTGWAQVRCGYSGSKVGSAWKVCHDLYYLKHRSFWLSLLILGETVRTLVADPQYTAEPSSVDFILAPTPPLTAAPAEAQPAAAV